MCFDPFEMCLLDSFKPDKKIHMNCIMFFELWKFHEKKSQEGIYYFNSLLKS